MAPTGPTFFPFPSRSVPFRYRSLLPLTQNRPRLKHWEVLKSTGNEPKLLNERNSSPLMYSPCHIVLRYKSLQSELTLKSSYTIYIVAKISMSCAILLYASCEGHKVFFTIKKLWQLLRIFEGCGHVQKISLLVFI